MSWIVVLESEGRPSESLREALSEDGWLVEVVPTYDTAMAAVTEHGPELVIANAELPEAGKLLNEMARGRGGPGSLALAAPGVRFDASDEVLRRPFSDQDLRIAVRELVTQGRAPKTPPAADDGERLTSQDLFGDVLAEVEESPAPAAAAPPAAPAEPAAASGFDRELSNLLEPERRKPAAPKRDEKAVDDLLSQTLAGLDVDERSRRKAGAAPARPKAAPQPPAKPVEPPAEAKKAAETAAKAGAAPPKKAARGKREIDFAELDALARPGRAPGEKTPSGIGSFATQKIAVPGLGKSASGPVEFGQYTLLERIALGGMAEVWKARMKGVEGFQKTVAIKKILPHLTDSDDFVTMFIDEAKLAAQLNHNNIIHIYDLGKIEDDYYIAMELVDGKDLRSILNSARERDRPLPLGLSLLVASRLAAALDHAHRQKDFEGHDLHLVHRDVSPQNVLISWEGDIKLCDFGIVKAVSKVSKTQMGALKGKIQYMSPEQAWGRPVDARSDLFSLGALLFEMLTGRKLFAGETEVAVLDAVREGRIQAPRDLDPRIPLEVNALVLRALAKEPRERFANASDLQHELDLILASLKPVPTQLELSRYLRELFGAPERSAELAAAAPEPATAPAKSDGGRPVPAPAPVVAGAPPTKDASPAGDAALEATGLGGGKALWIGLAAAVVLAVVGFLAFGGDDDATAPAPPAVEERAAPTPDDAAASGETVAPPAAGAGSPGETAPAEPTPDRIEPAPDASPAPAAAAAAEPAAVPTPATAEPEAAPAPTSAPETVSERKPAPPAATTPAPVAEKPAVPTAQPGRVPAEAPAASAAASSEPESAPTAAPTPAPAPAPRRAEPKPEPTASAPPAAPPAPRVREGDLVALGPGVTPPQLVSVDKPQYPPMARRLKVEGTVIVSVLVDENGRVTDVRLESGVRQNVGINEAAIETARSAKFRPAEQDGVRVKTWYRLNIPFKL